VEVVQESLVAIHQKVEEQRRLGEGIQQGWASRVERGGEAVVLVERVFRDRRVKLLNRTTETAAAIKVT
jgi:xanthine/CO dehydrogenase XdhC/CoxF family maturation factor